MTRATVVLATLVSLLLPAAARAQGWTASGLFGVVPPVGLERRAPELDELDIRSGYTFGLQLSRFVTPHVAAEVLWTQQRTALQIGTASGTADLFTMMVSQIHGNAVYHVRPATARTRPFVFAGLGATFLSAVGQPGEAKLSFGFGAGAEMFLSKWFGVRGHFRYKPTPLNDEDAGRFCDPFGFCQGSLQQTEFMTGAVLRF